MGWSSEAGERMKVIRTDLDGCLLLEPRVFEDERGFFYESFNADAFAEAGLPSGFVQGNVSSSTLGVLRGLHYQWPNPQGKLVSVLEGEVWDVAVDIRRESPRFGQWTAAVLSADNKRHFWIPEGFAHGFVVLSPRALFTYLCTATYDRNADAAIRWDDPQLAIDWPVSAPRLAPRDANAPFLADIDPGRLPRLPA
jgi:dTDP-4-dehydrorhamnose 3,5-epimerase